MTPLQKQFDAAQHDAEWRSRDNEEYPEQWDEDDDYITHMQTECRMGRFV